MSDTHLRYDFMGRKVCDHCWCGMHEIYRTDPESQKTRKLPNCLGHGCECLCTRMQAEKRARRARASYTIAETPH